MADSKLDPNKSYGWTGKILRVNLTDKTVSVSPTDPYKEYLGGMGIANKIMYDEVPAGTDPFSPENKLIFAVGPLTASGVPCSGRMNVTFRSPSDEMDAKFVAESVKAGFTNLKGHRSVGGMRASIYNAMPTEGVEKLCEFIQKFEKEN